jgi:hypothetical protein
LSAARREVRASASFFDDLDRQLPQTRGHAGEPSAHDLLAADLFDVIDVFATEFESLPPARPHDLSCRLLVRAGSLVGMYAIAGQLMPDGAIELISLDVDLGPVN